MSTADAADIPPGALVLVTGGAGYIGSVVVGQLLAAGFRIRTIDSLRYGGEALHSFCTHPQFEFVRGDIRRADDVRTSVEGVSAVVHLAAVVGESACDREPDLARETNDAGSRLLCGEAERAGAKRFIFASTCSNYGISETANALIDETAPLRPISLYAELKVGLEEFLLHHESGSMVTTCLRFATAYGLSGRPRFDLTVNEFTRDLLLGRNLEIYGEHCWRPYCHTVDLARACVAVLEADRSRVANQAFNVGNTDENYRKRQLVEQIVKRVSGAESLVTYVQRDHDPRDYRVNCDRIHRRLGFKTTRQVPDGITEVIGAIESGLIGDPDNPRYRNH